MKNLTILLAVLALVFACEKEKPEPDIVVSDIMIRGQESLKSTVYDNGHLTPQEIAKQATYIVYDYNESTWRNDILPEHRDTVNGIIIRDSWDILHPETHQLNTVFVEARNMVLQRYYNGYEWNPTNGYDWPYIDTIGYIPNAVLENAYNLIIDAYEREAWQEIYDVFNSSFVFIPITGPEYRELQSQGLN